MINIIVILVPIYLLLTFVGVLFKHFCFETFGWDLGIYHQAMSNLSRFDEWNPFISILQTRIFNDHFDPIIVLLAPALRLWNSAIMLLVLDQIAVFAGLIPIVLWMEEVLKRRSNGINTNLLHFAVIFGYLFTDHLWNALLFPSHPTQWAMAFIAWVFYFYEKRQFRVGFWLTFVLLLMCKEEFPFFGLTLATALWLRREKRVAFSVGTVSIVFLFVAFFIRPSLAGELRSHTSFIELLVTNPASYWDRWSAVLVLKDVWFPIVLVVLSLPIISWKKSTDLILAMSALFAIRLFSLRETAFTHQYMAVFVPFLSFALLRSYADNKLDFRFLRITAWRYILIAIVSLAFHRLPFHHTLRPISRYHKYQDEYISRQGVIERLKGKAIDIAAPNNWTPHLTDHKSITMAAVWLEAGNAKQVDIWIWDEKSDNFPSKLKTSEIQEQARFTLGDSFDYEEMQIDRNVQLWIKRSFLDDNW